MIPFTGRDIKDSIKVAVDDLRKANAKFIELDYEKDINKNLRQIIVNDSILAEQARQENILLRRSCSKVKTQRNIGFSTAVVLLLILLMK